MPPKDLIEDVAAALIEAGIDVDAYFEDACSVTKEWKYNKEIPRIRNGIQQKYDSERAMPLKVRNLEFVLKPQPEAAVVIERLLGSC